MNVDGVIVYSDAHCHIIENKRALVAPLPNRPTCEALQALTLVVVLLIDAGAVVLAGPRGALVDVDLAGVTLETGDAEAAELRLAVHADGPVLAGLRGALVHVALAGLPFEPRRAEAPEALRAQHAGPVAPAGPVDAVRHARPAAPPAVASGTPAEVPVGLVHAQGAGPGARVALALVHLLGAVLARESVGADAAVPRGAGRAGAILAGREGAGVVQLVAVLAHVSDPVLGTDAGVVVHGVHAGGSVVAGRGQTPVRRGIAEDS